MRSPTARLGPGLLNRPMMLSGWKCSAAFSSSSWLFLAVFVLLLASDAVHLGQHVAHAQLDRDAIGLLELQRILHALGALGKQLFGRLAHIGIDEWRVMLVASCPLLGQH